MREIVLNVAYLQEHNVSYKEILISITLLIYILSVVLTPAESIILIVWGLHLCYSSLLLRTISSISLEGVILSSNNSLIGNYLNSHWKAFAFSWLRTSEISRQIKLSSNLLHYVVNTYLRSIERSVSVGGY